MLVFIASLLILLLSIDIFFHIKKHDGGDNALVKQLEKDIEEKKKDIGEKKQQLEQLQNEKLDLTTKFTEISTRYIDKCEECKILNENLKICKDENEKITRERNEIFLEKNVQQNKLDEQDKSLQQFKKLIEENQKKYEEMLKNTTQQQRETFENISNNIIKLQKDEIVKTHEQNLAVILNPLKDNLEKFKKEVEDSKIKSVENTKVIETQILNLVQGNTEITKSADNLTKALLGDKKMQGNYGEMQLKKILDDAGFVEDRDYFTQYNIKDSEGKNYFLDLVFNISGEKSLIIDSKLSLVNYYRYVNCDIREEAEKYLEEYRSDIKKHIKELSEKEYQKLYKTFRKNENRETLDFVFMFLPLEKAYIDAVNGTNNDILLFANERKISIVTASSLMSLCNVINYIWNIEKQNRNVEKIVELGGELYKKLCGFTDDLREVGNCIEKAKKMYDESFKKLSTGNGNAIKKAEELKEKLAGSVKITKKLAFVEESKEEENI